MTIPFEPSFFGIPINIHLILEYLAFFLGYRYYVSLRKNTQDAITTQNRFSIILGAILGAFLGSRLSGYFENPVLVFSLQNILDLLNTKSIMGGLFGGLLGVEIAKKIIHEKHSSGDLFTFPIILGIIIGRMGCFLMGVKEFTYGIKTNSITGMNLGDGYLRHPIALYEIFFLIGLFFLLKKLKNYTDKESGLSFKIFMISYFGFRFFIEFIKPNVFYILHLSSIQWLCLICWTYYTPTLKKLMKNAYKKIHVL